MKKRRKEKAWLKKAWPKEKKAWRIKEEASIALHKGTLPSRRAT